MKILFTLLAIDAGREMYLQAAKRLTTEILQQTSHDVLLSTNNILYFKDVKESRFIVRDNILNSSLFKYATDFNYNLKHHAFLDIPTNYDFLIYLDCDIKLSKWTHLSEEFMETTMSKYEFGADRLNCYLKNEVNSYLSTTNCLFKHKIKSYNITEKFNIKDDIMNSRLPSEHFLIFKNISSKIKLFQEKWQEQNDYLQTKGLNVESWGDGFEIGIAARYAGFTNILEMNSSYWQEILGFRFNGNKFCEKN
jgi:hypothetical protein